MKKLVPILLAFALYSCDNSETIALERSNPTSYLSIEMEPWSLNSDHIDGTLINNASKTDYTNTVLIVQYHSEDGTKLGTERKTEYNVLKAGESRTFTHKINTPAATQNLNIIVERAQFIDWECKEDCN